MIHPPKTRITCDGLGCREWIELSPHESDCEVFKREGWALVWQGGAFDLCPGCKPEDAATRRNGDP